ncbi:MAG TPA: hypothetical protein QF720_06615 [Nitrospinota bacterium]|jgi:hypothetical protein|nr:hypothetical protein [Nitrospinota bacterium]|tara:strand:- start:98330 stop:98512 length:183 start_codon:yes stop_codon:yes gene_type:complete
MSDELLSAGKWAKELSVPEKKFKEALKSAGVEPDKKKGACAYYSRKTAQKVAKLAKLSKC